MSQQTTLLKDIADINKELIIDFITSWSTLNPSVLAQYFAEDGVYYNIPSKPIKGRKNIEKYIGDFTADWLATNWEIISIVAESDTVIVERLDKTIIKKRSVNLPCTGVFKIEGGKIKEWRDYFDLYTYMRGVGILNLAKFAIRQMS